MALALFTMGALAAAEPPEIIRLRLPGGKVPNWFPEGTPLRMLAPGELDSLLRNATRTAGTADSAVTPRLVRARHQASWDAGVLRGSIRARDRGGLLRDRPPFRWSPGHR